MGHHDGHHPLEIPGWKASRVRDGAIVQPDLGDGIVTFDVDMGWITGFMAVEEEPEGSFPVEGGSHGASMNIRLLLACFKACPIHPGRTALSGKR